MRSTPTDRQFPAWVSEEIRVLNNCVLYVEGVSLCLNQSLLISLHELSSIRLIRHHRAQSRGETNKCKQKTTTQRWETVKKGSNKNRKIYNPIWVSQIYWSTVINLNWSYHQKSEWTSWQCGESNNWEIIHSNWVSTNGSTFILTAGTQTNGNQPNSTRAFQPIALFCMNSGVFECITKFRTEVVDGAMENTRPLTERTWFKPQVRLCICSTDELESEWHSRPSLSQYNYDRMI